MKRVELGRGGLSLSQVCYGAWRLTDNNEDHSIKAVHKKIETCFEMGITSFDHADIYGDYACEKVFGDVLREMPNLRDKMEIISKCGIKLISSNRPDHRIKSYDTSEKHLRFSVENSLKNLATDHLDLLLIHRPNPFMDYEKTAIALDTLVKEGKVKNLGVSNFTTWQFDTLNNFLENKLVTNQIEASVLHLDGFHDGTVAQCQKHKIAPMAWSPLGGGQLFSQSEKAQRVMNVLERVGKENNLTAAAVAFSFLSSHPSKMIPIIGTNKLERIKELAASDNYMMDEETWHEIWSASTGVEVP